MSHPTSPHAYPDVREAFDLALAHGQALQPFAGTPDEIRRAAIRWRQRAYTFRSRLRDELAKRIDGPVATPYDSILCRVTPAGVEITDEARPGAILPAVPIGPEREHVPDLPESIPDFDAIAKEHGLD